MNQKKSLDSFIGICRGITILLSVCFLFVLYDANLLRRDKLLWLLIFIIYIACYSIIRLIMLREVAQSSIHVEQINIESVALLNESGNIVEEWPIEGKNGLIIGKSKEGFTADIDLANLPEAPYVSKKHAVLNYALGKWYIEDLDSRNGIQIKKPGIERSKSDNRKGPILLERGDLFYIDHAAFVMR